MDKQYKIFGVELIEQNAIDQFHAALEAPWVVKGALMPDSHVGYSLPIGGVVGTDGVIVPSWVGYDIGCGVLAIQTVFTTDDLKSRLRGNVYNRIRREIPNGTGSNFREAPYSLPKEVIDMPHTSFAHYAYEGKGVRDLGTLGAGNHFIEIGHDEENNIWITIHSGSRGFGHHLANNYMKIAGGGRGHEGTYPLSVTSDDGKNYINDLAFALAFALENRNCMMTKVVEIIHNEITKKKRFRLKDAAFEDSFVNRNHNHADLKDGLWIHRKGATHAEDGMMGVIPGNMASGVFIVRGKGNPDSLYSSSHGAGRKFDRKIARETLTMEAFKEAMQGVVASVSSGTIDEAPMAYKDPMEVMKMQEDLVEIVHQIKPLINIKGLDANR